MPSELDLHSWAQPERKLLCNIMDFYCHVTLEVVLLWREVGAEAQFLF